MSAAEGEVSAAVELVGLEKRYGDRVAVAGVDLHIEAGQIFGLLGPNGAGKSTTIRMIVNIIRPDIGQITYDGGEFNDTVRSAVGYLSEERGLYQKARILETILYFAGLRGLDERTARVRALWWLDQFDLAGSEKRRVEELSKGNQQKVQIIIALIHEPQYIIMDEPASGLDPINQELLRKIITDLRSQGRTLIYSTHLMDVAERVCNRIALIDKGRVVLDGTVDHVRASHGRNIVRVEFSGDAAGLRALPLVMHTNMYPNFAELQLQDGATVNDLLPHLTAMNLNISKIESVRPSLNSIFLQTVGRHNREAEAGEATV